MELHKDLSKHHITAWTATSNKEGRVYITSTARGNLLWNDITGPSKVGKKEIREQAWS